MRKMDRKSILKVVIIRILFYGLFLLGPYILTESHIIHVRMQKECAVIKDDNLRMELTNKYKRWICALDIIGGACLCFWMVWLFGATGYKILKLLRRG